jgi:hypothetical protein
VPTNKAESLTRTPLHDEHGEEPQTRLNGAIRNKETIILMQRKENEHKMTSNGHKAISSAEPSSEPENPLHF